jgi:transposase
MEYTKITREQTKKFRVVNANNLFEVEDKIKNGMSERQAVNDIGVPRSTVRYWKDRASKIPLSSTVVNFFESPEGAKFLDCLITALQFVMTQMGPCGIRLISLVLELSNLHYFVASSYEALRKRGVEMENHIVAFGKEEKLRLSKQMPRKKISVAEDETFHPTPCLIAMEPISNFILLERYSDKRDAACWNSEMDTALDGLPVEVIQSTSDEARGIVNHAEQHLGAHHSPDIFHVQQDITKATSAPMSAKVSGAEKRLETLEKELKNRGEIEPNQSKKGRPSKLSQKSEQEMKLDIESNKNKLELYKSQQSAIKEAKKEIGAIYHPYVLSSGSKQTSEQLQQELHKHFETIENNAVAAELKQSSLDKIAKAKKVCSGLVATLTFFWIMLTQIIEPYSLPKEQEAMMYSQLIPANYLMIASKKAKTSEERKKISAQGEILMAQLNDNPVWKNLNDEEQQRLNNIAIACAQLFQRSSSCLEGRNGYLSLRHHGLHYLSDRKLETLTVIHNYFITRHDGTTAAERFFGQQPRNLFDYLMDKLPSVPRPAQKRINLSKAA